MDLEQELLRRSILVASLDQDLGVVDAVPGRPPVGVRAAHDPEGPALVHPGEARLGIEAVMTAHGMVIDDQGSLREDEPVTVVVHHDVSPRSVDGSATGDGRDLAVPGLQDQEVLRARHGRSRRGTGNAGDRCSRHGQRGDGESQSHAAPCCRPPG